MPSQFSNRFMAAVLRSPLHGLLSGSVMLITVTGRKSGKAYTTPVNYTRLGEGESLGVISYRQRTWWRNLRGGAAVTLRLKGRDVPGQATVIEDDGGVAAALAAILKQSPRYAKYLGVKLDPNGQPAVEDVAQAAQSRVVVVVTVEVKLQPAAE